MYTGMLHLHSVLRWVILLLLLIALFRHFKGMNAKTSVTDGDRKIDMFLMTAAHITLLVGLYQWIVGQFGLKAIQANGFSAVMKDSYTRFFAIEHLLGMIIAIVLITIGRGKAKRNNAWQAHKSAFWLFFIALIIILVTIPWPIREMFSNRTWFPGM